MDILHRKKIVLLGMMTKMPVAGVVWQTVHYLEGLRRLGYDVYYIEDNGHHPSSMLTSHPNDDRARKAADFISGMMRRFGFGDDHWAFHALYLDGQVYGLSDSQLRELYREAALI